MSEANHEIVETAKSVGYLALPPGNTSALRDDYARWCTLEQMPWVCIYYHKVTAWIFLDLATCLGRSGLTEEMQTAARNAVALYGGTWKYTSSQCVIVRGCPISTAPSLAEALFAIAVNAQTAI